MRTLHFIYTVPAGTVFHRTWNKLARLGILTPLYRSGSDFGCHWTHPIRAPHSVSYQILKALQKQYRVKLYSIYEHGICKTKPGDIVLAQPAPTLPKVPPEDIDRKAITYRTFTERSDITKIIIMPYSHDATYTRWWSELVREYGRNCIFISGEPWFKTWDEASPFKEYVIENKLRIDVGLDANDYPRVKKTFNPPNKRGIFYVGHTGWYKNKEMLEALAKRMPDVRFTHIGQGTIAGFEKRDAFAKLSPEYLTLLGETCDIFINVSTGDPNATTILEMTSAGFVVACTPESGYDNPHFVKLSAHDVEKNVADLTALLTLPEEQLVQQTEENRAYVLERYAWKGITDQVLAFVARVSR